MRIFFILAICFGCVSSHSQSDFKLGYQQFPTTILGHASDAQGNMYYTGTFKGVLTVNDSVLSPGTGLEDIFWVKTSPNGQITNFKIFSSTNSDYALSNGLAMGSNNQLYMISWSLGDMQFGDLQINGYQISSGGRFMNTIARMDTAGNVKWVRRTTANLLRVFSYKNLVHVFATTSYLSDPIKIEDSTLLDPLGKNGLLHMVFDTTGNLLGKKFIAASDNSHLFTLQGLYGYSDGSLLLSFQYQGNNGFTVNNSTVSLPSATGQYHILLKTDTSYTGFRAKVLNPGLQQVYGGGTTTLTAGLSSSDSLYTVLSVVQGSAYSIDGYSLPLNQNVLVVLDSTLTTKRLASLGSSFVASHPVSFVKRKIFFRSIENIGNNLMLTGEYVGANESPMYSVVPRDTVVPLIGATSGTVDLNGPSKSFVAKISLGLTNSSMQWMGDHKEYEYANTYPFLWHKANADRFVFLMNRDNTWNPWVVDTSLAIVSGAMKRNADRPETPQMVSFYPDGSKLIASYASGNTILDTSSYIVSNAVRRDLFFASFNPNGSLKWYNRIQSTLIQPTIRKMVVKNNKAWFLAFYVGTQNDSNYIKVNNQAFNVGVNASLLCSVDMNGNIVPLNLPNNVYKNGIIQDFSFFSNGDLALLVNTNVPFSVPGFSNAFGFYIFRVNPATGALIDTRKVVPDIVFPTVNTIEVSSNDIIYISSNANPNSSVASSKLYLYNSSGTIDFITMTNNVSSVMHTSLLQMGWNKINWVKQFSGNAGSSTLGYNNLFLVNDLPVLSVKTLVNNQPLLWENQPIHNGPYANRPTLVSIDTLGNMKRSRFLPLSGYNFLRKGGNEQLYISGYAISSLQVDTIQVGYDGGNDAITLVIDSTLQAKRVFRIASPYNESMYDADIFKDSVAAFAYSAQAMPTLYTYRTMTQNADYDPNAFVTTTRLEPLKTLPVQWLNFNAWKDGEGVRLQWNVSGTANNDHFEVEHRSENSVFTKIAAVLLVTGKTDYEFYHSSPLLNQNNYYRIKQVDKDGRISYSSIRHVKLSKLLFDVIPNPAADLIRIYTNQSIVYISIYEASGKVVLSKLLPGENNEIPVSHLPKGTYLLIAESNGERVGTGKFIKQ